MHRYIKSLVETIRKRQAARKLGSGTSDVCTHVHSQCNKARSERVAVFSLLKTQVNVKTLSAILTLQIYSLFGKKPESQFLSSVETFVHRR